MPRFIISGAVVVSLLASLLITVGASAKPPGSDAAATVALQWNANAVAGKVFWEEGQLPFPEALEARLLERLVGPITLTPLADGARATIEHYRKL